MPDRFKQPPLPRLDKASTAELVALLEHPNGWHRDTAARLLHERQDKSAIPALVKLLKTSNFPLGRLHALYALAGLDGLEEGHGLRALDDPDAHVREHAIKLAERFLTNGIPSERVWSKLAALTADPVINVRYQLAFTLGEVKDREALEALEQIARRDVASPWVQAAILSSLSEGAGDMFVHLSGDKHFLQTEQGHEFLQQLLRLAGVKNQAREISQVVHIIGRTDAKDLSFSFFRCLGEGLQRAGSSLQSIGSISVVQQLLADAATTSGDAKMSEAIRLEAIRLLALTTFAESGNTLLPLLGSDQSLPIQLAAIAALARFPQSQIASELVQRWSSFKPQARSAVLAALLARHDRVVILLQAFENGTIQSSELTTSQLKFLRDHRDAEVRHLALKVLGPANVNPRQQVVDAFQQALRLPGDAERGKTVYLQRCVSCHRLGGQGFALGPDLVTVKSAGKEKTLANILDPNREVAPQYIAFDIETKDGESSIGIIANETSSAVTLLQAYGRSEVIPRSNIKSMRSLDQSLMPEGLEQGLTAQDFANLLQYISTAEK